MTREAVRLVTLMVAVILAVVTLSRRSARAQDTPTASVDDPEAYSVYDSLLADEWSVTVAHASTLVFQHETVTKWPCMPSGGRLETDWKVVVDDFRRENTSTRLLRAGFAVGVPYLLVPAADILASFHDVPNDPAVDGWTGFYKRYPHSGGYIFMSAVGFDPVKRRAMVYMAHWCGGLCGGGTHHLLEKVEGLWREAGIAGVKSCAWAS